MTVDEVKRGRDLLEEAILASIREFEQATGCQVDGIDFTVIKTEEARLGETVGIRLTVMI